MAQPAAYTRQYDFAAFSSSFPSSQQPGVKLEDEFDAIKVTLDQVLRNIAYIQRDDYQVANLSIGLDQLKPEVVLGVPTDWVTATSYDAKAVVWKSGILYVCNTAHTSGVFATDLAADKWTAYLDYADPLGQALSYAADASGYADDASDYADAASTSADAADTSATAAAASASAAAASAAAAAAAVTALVLPLDITQGGTGASTAAGARTALGATTIGGALFVAANAAAAISALAIAANQAAYQTALGLGTAAVVADNTLAHLAGSETFTGAKRFNAYVGIGMAVGTLPLSIASAAGSGYALQLWGDSGTGTNNWYGGSEGNGQFNLYQGNPGAGTLRFRVDASNAYVGSAANNVVHAGNVSTYALPISGGTLTGSLTITKSGNDPLTLNNTDGSAKVRVQFKKAGTTKWELGTDINGTSNQDFFIYDNVAGSPRLQIDSSGVLKPTALQAPIAVSSETSGTLTAASSNRIVITTAGVTINDGVHAAYDQILIYNNSASSVTITQDTGMTLRLDGTTTTGNRTLGPRGKMHVFFNTNAEAICSGTGVS